MSIWHRSIPYGKHLNITCSPAVASGEPPSSASGVLGPESEPECSAWPMLAGAPPAAPLPVLAPGPCASWLKRLFRRCSARARAFLTAASALLLCAWYASSCTARHMHGADRLLASPCTARPYGAAQHHQTHRKNMRANGTQDICSILLGRAWACLCTWLGLDG